MFGESRWRDGVHVPSPGRPAEGLSSRDTEQAMKESEPTLATAAGPSGQRRVSRVQRGRQTRSVPTWYFFILLWLVVSATAVGLYILDGS
jgi:hypothetical protein